MITAFATNDLNLARPDDVDNAIVDAHKDLTDEQCRDFDARLILLLVNHVGDEAVIREALKEAAAKNEGQGAYHRPDGGRPTMSSCCIASRSTSRPPGRARRHHVDAADLGTRRVRQGAAIRRPDRRARPPRPSASHFTPSTTRCGPARAASSSRTSGRRPMNAAAAPRARRRGHRAGCVAELFQAASTSTCSTGIRHAQASTSHPASNGSATGCPTGSAARRSEKQAQG